MSVPVYVNIYRLIPTEDAKSKAGNDALEFIKMGVYHAGVEVLGQEYSFGMDPTGRGNPETDGIFVVRPRTAAGEFKEQVKLGDINIDRDGLKRVLDSLRPQWKAVTYHILNHNCCYFSLALSKALNPAFEATFPHYVYRAAGVGGAVVPDAVVASLTKALAPPTSVDPSLVNKIDAPAKSPAPRPGAARAPKTEAAPTSGLGGMFGMAKNIASQAAATVKAAVGVDDLKVLKETHPDVDPAKVSAEVSCDVMHIYREQATKIFVADANLCFTGENKLSLKLPYSAIAALSYGTKVAPATKGLPPTFELASGPSGQDTALLIWTADGKMIPLFNFASAVTSVIGKISGSTECPKMEAAFDAIDKAWRAVVRV